MGDAMDWEQIESKWQAMARRIRADLKDSTTPVSGAEAATAETSLSLGRQTPRPLDNAPKARLGAAA